MNRYPPATVRHELRNEVGFGCPVEGCGSPYLEYHHFDPPWRAAPHHATAGMIALCTLHHKKADRGAFTVAQLRQLKTGPSTRVAGHFDWLRNDLLAVVGGNFFYQTLTPVTFQQRPLIWFERGHDGLLRLSARMLSSSAAPRLLLDENDWVSIGSPTDLVCPPSGHLIDVKYRGGDAMRIAFFELASAHVAALRFAHLPVARWDLIGFPITAVELSASIGGTRDGFSPRETRFGNLRAGGNFSVGSTVGLAL